MRSANAKVATSETNLNGKAVWQKPQMRIIAITDVFDPSNGNSFAEWQAARELKARAARGRGRAE